LRASSSSAAPNPGSHLICCGGRDLKQSCSAIGGFFFYKWGVTKIEQAVKPDCGIKETAFRSIFCVYHCHLFGVSMAFGLGILI
jgi:hypothetical protein